MVSCLCARDRGHALRAAIEGVVRTRARGAALGRRAGPGRLEAVLANLSSPLYVTHARDGSRRLFVVEQGGRIQVLALGASAPTVFLDITARVLSGGEQGLLGLAFHPGYRTAAHGGRCRPEPTCSGTFAPARSSSSPAGR
jgi:hypothetical protein